MHLYRHIWGDGTVAVVFAESRSDAVEQLSDQGEVEERALVPLSEFKMLLGRTTDENADDIWQATFEDDFDYELGQLVEEVEEDAEDEDDEADED
jgi:hypothetical protein